MNMIVGFIYGSVGLIVLVMGSIILYSIYKKGFNYKVRIKRLTSNNTKVVMDVVGKVKRDKDSIPYIKLFFGLKNLKKKPYPNQLPMPAAEITDIDSKDGKLVIELYYDDVRGYTYKKDGMNIEMLHANKEAAGYETFPTGHKEMVMNQIIKKDQNKPKPMSEVIMAMAGPLTLVLILTMFLIFYGKALQPITEAMDSSAANLIKMEEVELQIATKLDSAMRTMVSYDQGTPLQQYVTPPEGGG